MESDARPHPMGRGALAVALLLLSPWAAGAQVMTRPDTATPSQSAVVSANAGSVHIFDNAFLDRLFGSRRAGDARRDAGLGTPDAPSLEPNQSLTAAIRRGIAPRHAVGLRVAEKGRQLLRAGEYQKAVFYLEKALSLYASPYMYYYLAQAHYELAQFAQSLSFLDVAESQLQEPRWATEVANLKARAATADRAVAARARDVNLASVW